MVALGGLVGGLQGCIWERFGGDCGGGDRDALTPGQTLKGIDPRAGAASLMASQTGQLRWTQVDQTTTLRSAVALTDGPSWVDHSCDGMPSTFEVPIVLALRTDDDRLNVSLDLSLILEPDGSPRTPAAFKTSLPTSTFVGKGVVSEAALDPGSRTAIEVYLDLVAANTGTGAAFSKGLIRVWGGDFPTIADMIWAQ